MIISCPKCATSFRADGSKIAPTGTKVRCAKCGHVWVQKPEAENAAPAAPRPAAAPKAPPPPPKITPKPEPEPPPAAAIPVRMPREEPPVVEPPAPEVEDDTPEDDVETPAMRRAREIEERNLRAAERRALKEREPAPRKSIVAVIFGWMVFLAVFGGICYGAIAYRAKIVSLWPQAGTLYKAVGLPVNLTGLDLRNIAYERQFADGVPVLQLNGEVVNTSKTTRTVPKLRASLRDGNGKELYFWTFDAAASRLGPGELSAFSSRLPSPPVESQELEVTFAGAK